VNVFFSLRIGEHILVPNGNCGLLVRIVSDVKADILPDIALARNPTPCGHSLVRHSHDTTSHPKCEQCSIASVFATSDSAKLNQHLRKGHTIEPFYALYRDIEIVGDADYNGVNGTTLAAPNSAGRMETYWRLRE
jgi:hypothetical protein